MRKEKADTHRSPERIPKIVLNLFYCCMKYNVVNLLSKLIIIFFFKIQTELISLNYINLLV